MTPYWRLGGLEDVYLEDSWVLDIVARPGTVRFDMDFVLRESHGSYHAPTPGEQYCYKRGRLLFFDVKQ